MIAIRTLAWILIPIASAPAAGKPIAEIPAPYLIVVDAVGTVLPEPLGAFIADHLEQIKGKVFDLSPLDRGNPRSTAHYVFLDAGASSTQAVDRTAAVASFPTNRPEAQRLFQLRGVTQGGDLPWVLAERWRRLRTAFQSGHLNNAVDQCSAIVHLAVDASMPFNTTRLGVKRRVAHRFSGGGREASTLRPPGTLRHRYQIELMKRLADRLAHEVRVSETRYQPLPDPLEATFEVLRRSYESVDPWLELDDALVGELDMRGVVSSPAGVDAYYDSLAERVADRIEVQLESAVLLAAGLIGAAWTQADAPPLVASIVFSGQQVGSRNAAGVSLVGSRHSTTIHASDCPHARRIHLENRVTFKSAAEALRSGRKGCKTCKPFEPGG